MGPRLFGIPATDAPVVAVIRRGPSGWSHVGRWDVRAGTYEPGAWTRGTLYPQRCDLSPDGRYLVYFVMKVTAGWAPGGTYIAVSRLPWLTALAAWGTDGTWTRGLAFVPRGTARYPPGPPEQGDAAPLLRRWALDNRRAASYAIERTRGWTETADSPPPETRGAWDELGAERITMEKARPGEPGTTLRVRGWYAAHRGGEPGRGPARYSLAAGGPGAAERPLNGLQWADWAADGRLLVATTSGELQVREDPHDARPSWTADLAAMTPDPRPAPPWASGW
ncbi:MAG TPA: hypothetical protein VFY23_15290 [Candidatus Limnocylindrales bacterium]|nr:hypothetical protein [Candidatus Limnocylindrales bacterium]